MLALTSLLLFTQTTLPAKLNTAAVSFSLRNSSYADFCKDLTRQTGTEFSAVGRLSDRKISIYCTSRPASEVIRMAEKTLLIHFEPSGKGVQLTQTAAQKKAELDQERIDEKADIQEMEDSLQLLKVISEASTGQLAKLALGVWPASDEPLPLSESIRKKFDSARLKGIVPPNPCAVSLQLTVAISPNSRRR
jgi:hypothetical protein